MTGGPSAPTPGLLVDSPAIEARISAVERPAAAGHRSPRRGEAAAARVEADAARQEAGRQAHVERAEHVAPPERRQERGLGQRGRERAQRLGRHLAGLGVRGRGPR